MDEEEEEQPTLMVVQPPPAAPSWTSLVDLAGSASMEEFFSGQRIVFQQQQKISMEVEEELGVMATSTALAFGHRNREREG